MLALSAKSLSNNCSHAVSKPANTSKGNAPVGKFIRKALVNEHTALLLQTN